MQRANRSISLASLCLFAASTAVLSQQVGDQSGTKATVVLKAGSTLELDDFAFCSSQQYPKAYYTGSRSATKRDFALKVNQFWRVIQLGMLKSLERLPAQDPQVRDWAAFSVVLTSGEQFSAQLPLTCAVTWLGCDGFEFAGKTSVLGLTADFAIELTDLRSIGQGTAGHYQVVDTAGKATTLDSLTYQSHSTPPVPFIKEFAFNRVTDSGGSTSYGQSFEVAVGRSKVPVKLEQIESLVFSNGPPDDIRLRMRTGEEADGHLPDRNQIARGFGRTAAGLIWFEDISTVRSITFGPLAARR